MDLFSLGCLFYYVLSGGHHPFGEAIRRQANILSGEWSLSELKGSEEQVVIQKMLVAALISPKAKDRPPCDAVLSCPIFWDGTKTLAFLQVIIEISRFNLYFIFA